MKPTKKAYIDVEKMVLALMFATQRFGSYLLPRHFIIITMEDIFPHALQHMDVSTRISKWIVRLQEFDYTVVHTLGNQHAIVDYLSRLEHSD